MRLFRKLGVWFGKTCIQDHYVKDVKDQSETVYKRFSHPYFFKNPPGNKTFS